MQLRGCYQSHREAPRILEVRRPRRRLCIATDKAQECGHVDGLQPSGIGVELPKPTGPFINTPCALGLFLLLPCLSVLFYSRLDLLCPG